MNDTDVSKQIQQMVRFIHQEAEEKANEISVSAEEEFNIEKLQLVEAEKKKIRQEYERKERQVEIRKKIEYSMQLNASRIKVLQAQDDVISSMKEAASKELLHVSHHSHHHHVYRNLLKDLIVQSLLRLKEPSVLLRCRKHDQHLVEHVLDSAVKEYADKANVDPPEIIVDNQVYLPPGPSHHNAHDPYCSLVGWCWLLVMERLFVKTLLMQDLMWCSVKSFQRSESSSLDKLLLEDFD
ncbi:V-type proton ATPase subunit E-like isoform X2 [Abrus precatorius]|uniref:V-type proton ATPase subunit E-like isoform X2 n=1 Tax=Abrus precatorius TaxID=3816 RepID=A0A8B8KIC4_ABRPR|nr:V-type proton ATPase subunit E-like isoform X2 [Abrus precatorius]